MKNALTRLEALELVRSHYRTDAEMAAAFDVTQPTVWRWLRQSKQLPAEHVLTAERLTGISRHDLRPDIYPRDYPPAPEFMGVDSGRLHVSFNRHGTLQAGRPA